MKKIFFLIAEDLKFLLRCLFAFIEGGKSCIICGQKSFLYPVCKKCRDKHFNTRNPALYENRCSVCGKKLLSTKDSCFSCREEVILKSPDSMLPLFPYRLWNKELMFKWKSQEERIISLLFAGLLRPVLKKLGTQFIVPVPPRKGKIREKGWDQIDELCNILEYKYGFKILRLLERKTSMQQKKLDREGRLKQIGHSYSCIKAGQIHKVLKPYGTAMPDSVILLDDVCTTGSTIESCALLLKEAGIKSVNALCLFVVD